MYIPELKYTFYGPIVLFSILIGIIVACLLMHKAGVEKKNAIYTAVLTFVSIITFSFIMSFNLTKDIRKVGFVGAGGALGLIIGIIISVLIHRDHIRESICAWIISAPLMYGLSKIACHIAGCCNGIPYSGHLAVSYGAKSGESFFPVQLAETVCFLIVFALGLILYFKLKDKLLTASIILMLSALTKIGLEFLRESHIGQTISTYQIIVFSIAAGGVMAIYFTNRITTKKGDAPV